MLLNLKKQLEEHLRSTLKSQFPSESPLPPVELEIPAERINGDFATNIALKSAKLLRKAPLVIANEFLPVIKASIDNSPWREKIAKLEVKNPGFINIFLTDQALFEVIDTIFQQADDYGRSTLGSNKKVQIEFVSANPTGPLSVAHARQAAVGDALGNILKKLGFSVTKEFYVNDEGNQINILGRSIKARATEILTGKVDFPEDGYQGAYIKDMAQIFMDQRKVKDLDQLGKFKDQEFSQFGVDYLLAIIKKELTDFGVNFDVWSHQSVVASEDKIPPLLDFLKSKGHVYEKDGAVWFKSTDLGDDKDRVLKKSDGLYTYLTPDIVYHKNKFERKFDLVINMWGPDHHGYIPRLKAAVQALGYDPNALQVLIVQLATIFRHGEVVSMSTRRGQYISLQEVMDEVGVDASRFFFLMRHISAHLEFDLELAKKQTAENPVYYVQYAHARVFSVNKKALDAGIKIKQEKFQHLKDPIEIALIKKLGEFPETLKFCSDQLDPYPLISYMQELATSFHKFYDQQRILDDNRDVASERLGLSNASRIVLANGLRLLGVSTPEKM